MSEPLIAILERVVRRQFANDPSQEHVIWAFPTGWLVWVRRGDEPRYLGSFGTLGEARLAARESR